MLAWMLALTLTVGSSYAIITITKMKWRSLGAVILVLYAFSMSVLLSMAIIALVDAIWFVLFHTSFLNHLKDGDLLQHLEAGWK